MNKKQIYNHLMEARTATVDNCIDLAKLANAFSRTGNDIVSSQINATIEDLRERVVKELDHIKSALAEEK